MSLALDSSDRDGTDRAHMARALDLAARGLNTTDPNPRVGCVLVRGGETLGEGWHERAGEAHAEVAALEAARGDVRGATAYVSLEPCSHTGRTPPCVDSLIAAGIGRVVCASVDPNPRVAGAGIERLKAAGMSVSVGILENEARALNPGFFSRFERGRPYVRLKLAMSLDGRTAPAGGGAMWISGEASRADVQRWRARSSAVLTGAGTVRTDDPRLDVRWAYGPWVQAAVARGARRDPRLPPRRQSVSRARARWCSHPRRLPRGRGTARRAFAARRRGKSPHDRWPIGRQGGTHPIDRARSERALGGMRSALGRGLPRGGLVDEWIIYVAPRLLGADAAPLTALAGLDARGASFAFDIMSVASDGYGREARPRAAPRGADSRRAAPCEQGAERCSREL
jgi:diaminohydroxyphosphoribosylaminopyrimidine deaminase/5-amino-6-(5-phosphoribosylamino)uracil reductase